MVSVLRQRCTARTHDMSNRTHTHTTSQINEAAVVPGAPGSEHCTPVWSCGPMRRFVGSECSLGPTRRTPSQRGTSTRCTPTRTPASRCWTERAGSRRTRSSTAGSISCTSGLMSAPYRHDAVPLRCGAALRRDGGCRYASGLAVHSDCAWPDRARFARPFLRGEWRRPFSRESARPLPPSPPPLLPPPSLAPLPTKPAPSAGCDYPPSLSLE